MASQLTGALGSICGRRRACFSSTQSQFTTPRATIAFEARWWNTATSPESSLVDPGGSPWAALSQEEIRELLAKLDAKR